ncbi:MAG: hypothetical protein CMG62_03265 [Candidatus Marinimicrobia bacterium]|nr:hypothetical protein [Candidatus Neomarinimicrobiota bacterium]
MTRVLIISATRGNNLDLSHKVGELLSCEKKIVVLEDFPMPVYNPDLETSDFSNIKILCQDFIDSDGLIFCAPEYNGGSPPILTNTITWLSVSTSNWRDAFLNKKALIATHSGGAGFRFLSTFRIQLEHLGTIVYPRNIIINRSQAFNKESSQKILKGFLDLI